MLRFLLPAVLRAQCDKCTLHSLPRVCCETPPESLVLLPYWFIQDYRELNFFIVILEMIKKSQRTFHSWWGVGSLYLGGMHSGMFCFGAKETFLEPALFCLVVPSSSTSGFYLVAQDGCSSSRPWVSSSVIGLEDNVYICPLKHSLLSFTSCWPGLRHEFIVRHTRKCSFLFFFFFLSSPVPC